ncbi:hypothetical protein [Marinimicrobium sp. ABcell2]|uniref:hypothetical protein n=1 Tax=Marinimicrobium sp. ABcell2 TaxID=3069751 RepID=UPI0027B27800|nr:hypothetical protein [Marinimicrobium sp. ABcell2]MDQ2077351.1 hypothetical protein [Marinimicrobium sp. ABcell2]
MIEYTTDEKTYVLLTFLLIFVVGFAGIFVTVALHERRERRVVNGMKDEDRLYQKGLEHGLRGYRPNQEGREAYQDGYSDGRLRRAEQAKG